MASPIHRFFLRRARDVRHESSLKRRNIPKRVGHSLHTRLRSESLETRTLLAITTFDGGPVSDYLIVTSGPNAPGQAADDVFITRTAAGRLLIADNSSFSPQVLPGNFDTPDILFVTNGEPGGVPGPISPGNNTVANGGIGSDAQANSTTTFVLRNGSIVSPDYVLLGFDLVPNPNPIPPYYNLRPTNPAPFQFLIAREIIGRVSYNGQTWDFALAPDGFFYFAGPRTGIHPIGGSINYGDHEPSPLLGIPSGTGRGVRGSVSIDWSGAIATVPHRGAAQPPTLEISYTAGIGRDAAFNERNLRPSAIATPSFLFDVGANGPGEIIQGTLTGTINVDTVRIGQVARSTISFPFTTDFVGGATLYFGDQTFGENDWLRVRGTHLGSGRIDLSFEAVYGGDGIRRDPGNIVNPGPVTLTDLRFLRYVTPALPNDFTLFAGHDLPSQLHVDLRAAGSSISIDSPLIVQAPERPASNVIDVDLRATTVTLNARTQSLDDLFIGASRSGAVAETVTLNANVSVPNTATINVRDEPANNPAPVNPPRLPGPTRGRLLVSQSGSIAATFFTISPPFGDPTIPQVRVETEPNDDGIAGVAATDIPFAQNLGGSFSQVAEGTFRATLTGTIARGNDEDLDFYAVPLRANDLLTVALDAIFLRDPFVRLVAADGTQLASDDDSGPGLNALLTFQNGDTDRLVYIAADSFSSSSGSYRLTATVSGAAATPTNVVLVTAESSDVFIEGSIFGNSQSYLMRSPESDRNKLPFVISTRSPRTGADVGLVRGGTAQIILANDGDTPLDLSIAYNTVDLKTRVDSLRVRASVRQNGVDTSPSGPFPYNLSIREADALRVEAVAASTLPIDIRSDGTMQWFAALSTFGDVRIRTEVVSNVLQGFSSVAPIGSSFGTISIEASDINLGGAVTVSDAAPLDPTRTDIQLFADNGNVGLEGLLASPNRIQINTPSDKAGLVAGGGRIKTRSLSINAQRVGNPQADPTDPRFYLRTEVDSFTGEVQSGFAIDEKDDLAINELTCPSGTVAIRAGGFDGRPGSPNDLALTANLIDVKTLFVTVPNGSIDIRNETGDRTVLGLASAIRDGKAESMKAAGSVTIVSSAGGFDILDAPVAGSGARIVNSSTARFLAGARYLSGEAGRRASTIEARAFGSLNALRTSGGAFEGVGRVFRLNDRVLVRHGAGDDPNPTIANGVYVVTRLGSDRETWELTRAADSDTVDEIPTNTVVRNVETNQFFRLTHAMTTGADFVFSITVEGELEGFEPITSISSGLVVPQNSIQYVVSSSDGTTLGAGSLGKMISLRQENDLLDDDQVQAFAFSSLLTQPIVLGQELPRLTKPFLIDGNNRFTPAGFTAAPQPIVVNGQLINATAAGDAIYTGTTSAQVQRAAPERLILSPNFANTAELRRGMAVSGIGIRPGATITAITVESGRTVVMIDTPVEVIFNRRTNSASLSVTFSTELNGFHFVKGSSDGGLANLAVGGFTRGAAVKVESVSIGLTQMRIGSDATDRRLGNQVGVFTTAGGTATITGGSIVASSIAGIRTAETGAVRVTGTTIGSAALPNINGIEINGTGGARIGTAGGADTFVQFNRYGIVLRAGTNTVVNTNVVSNSFDGIRIEGGRNTIGTTERSTVGADSNFIYANGQWGINIISTVRAQQRVFSNIFGSDPAQSSRQDNVRGNVGSTNTDGATTPAGPPFNPNSATALDANGNQHGLRAAAAPGLPVTTRVKRPWRARR